MKTRPLIALVLLALVFTIAAVAYFSLRPPPPLPPEPTYQGRTASDWWHRGYAEQKGYRAAFAAMGSNAVPFIFREYEENNSYSADLHRELWLKLPAFIRYRLTRPWQNPSDLAATAQALYECGTNAMPLIFARRNDRNHYVREAVWMTIEFNGSLLPTSTNEMLSACRNALYDSNSLVRGLAAEYISRLGPISTNAIPDLIKVLRTSEPRGDKSRAVEFDHGSAAYALGKIGPPAVSAIPALTALLTSTNQIRLDAAIALWNIASNFNSTYFIITNSLTNRPPIMQVNSINALGSMGPRAKSAFPLLANNYANLDTNETPQLLARWRTATSNALIAIDPQAAAQFFATQKLTNR